MTTKNKPIKRLRIKDNCSIDGVREGKRLKQGIYIIGKNLSEEERDTLILPQFAHAVEILDNNPPAEVLAEDAPLPQEDPAITHLRKKREAEEAKYRDRWPAGRPAQTRVD